MKQSGFMSGALVALVGLVAAGTAQAADAPSNELIARVQRVTAGGRQIEVTDRNGDQVRVVWPVRPPQAERVIRDGDLVNASALHEDDMVRLTGVRRDGS